MRTMTAIELTATEFDITWSALGLGRVPYPLGVPSAGTTARDRVRLTERVRGTLRDRGLWHDQPSPELAELLRVLARPDRSVDAIAHLGAPLRALAAGTHRLGVLATLGPDAVVRLAEIHPAVLVESIVDLLRDAPPGPGTALSVPVTVVTDNEWFSQDAADLRALLAERTAGGQFGVTVTDQVARRHRASTLVTWFDTRRGRYLIVRDGEWLSLAPADNRRIGNRLRQVDA